MDFWSKLSWFLYNATNALSLIISVVYWSALFNPAWGFRIMDFLIHGFNSITSLIDLFIGKRPCQLLHFYQPLTVLSAFVTFSAIYWAAGGRNEYGMHYIYPILDWDRLSFTFSIVIPSLVIVLPLLHGVLWGLHQLRDCCFNQRRHTDYLSDADINRQPLSQNLKGEINYAFKDVS